MNKPLIVTDAAAFLVWLQENTSGPYGLDCETVGVDPTEESPVGKGTIICWSLAWIDHSLGTHPETGTPIAKAAFLEAGALPVFRDWLRTANVVGHNVFSFDRHVFANNAVVLDGVVADTLRMAKLLDADSSDNSLKSWMRRAFGYGVGAYDELFSRRKPGALEDFGEPRSTWRKVDDQARVPTLVGGTASRVGAARDLIPLDTVARDYPHLLPTLQEYAALDAKGTLELYFLLRRRLERTPWRGLGQAAPWGTMWDLYERFWNPSLYVINDIERNGIQYDASIAAAGSAQAEMQRRVHEAEAYAWVGRPINLNSAQQLGEVLYRERFYEIPPVTGTLKAIKINKEEKPTTSEAALMHLAINNPSDATGIESILKERKLTDLVQFLDRLPTFQDAGGRIHTLLKPDTRTGRRSSSKPNLQNIPKDDTYGLRSAFVAAPGHRLVVADYAALEPRVQAHFLNALFHDTSLLDAINFGDVYCGVVKDCWPEYRGWSIEAIKATPRRAEAKVVLLAKAYGKGLHGMALQLKKPLHEVRAIVQRIDDAFPGVVRFQKHMAEYAREHGGVHTLLGRFRPLPNIRSTDRGLRAGAERQAYNSPIQGSATDIMVAAQLKLNPLVKLVLEVHDELIAECPTNLANVTLQIVTEVMQAPLKPGLFSVPLIVEAHIGTSWAEAKG